MSSGSYIRTIVLFKFFIRMQEECIRVQEEFVHFSTSLLCHQFLNLKNE